MVSPEKMGWNQGFVWNRFVQHFGSKSFQPEFRSVLAEQRRKKVTWFEIHVDTSFFQDILETLVETSFVVNHQFFQFFQLLV